MAQDGGVDPHDLTAAHGFLDRCRSRPASSCVGRRAPNPCRFSRANERSFCVEILENTEVFSSAFALPVRPFVPRKLRSTLARAKIEGFLHRQEKLGWRPASAKMEKAPVLAVQGRQGFGALRPMELPGRFERPITYVATSCLSSWLWKRLAPGRGFEPQPTGSKPMVLTVTPARKMVRKERASRLPLVIPQTSEAFAG